MPEIDRPLTEIVNAFPPIQEVDRVEQEQNFKQQHLNIALDQFAISNSYHTKAVVANYISTSLVISAVTAVLATAAFSHAFGDYNDTKAVSLSLCLASYILATCGKIFSEKMTEFRLLSQINIDLANGRDITHITKFVDPKTAS